MVDSTPFPPRRRLRVSSRRRAGPRSNSLALGTLSSSLALATLSSSLAMATLSRGLVTRHRKHIPCLGLSSPTGLVHRSMASRSQSTLRRSAFQGLWRRMKSALAFVEVVRHCLQRLLDSTGSLLLSGQARLLEADHRDEEVLLGSGASRRPQKAM